MLLITGPTAAGKNTIGRLLAQQQERCAVVDFDLVRAMFVQPHRAPWQGLEGRAQHQLGIQHVCQIALGFHAAGWKVVVLDVVTNDVVQYYQMALQSVALVIIQLLPSLQETARRFYARGPVLTDAEFEQVYREQEQFRYATRRIDTTTLSPEAVVGELREFL
ncbi:MAG: hypothetical protein ABIV47_19070 [Roseiflexaceae bacterium]